MSKDFRGAHTYIQKYIAIKSEFMPLCHKVTGVCFLTQGPRDALCQSKSCQMLHRYTKKITFERPAGGNALKVNQDYQNFLYLIGHMSLPSSY